MNMKRTIKFEIDTEANEATVRRRNASQKQLVPDLVDVLSVTVQMLMSEGISLDDILSGIDRTFNSDDCIVMPDWNALLN